MKKTRISLSKAWAAPADERSLHDRWSSSPLFVLATVGAVIGFKNIWQFPHLVSEYGGGAFLVVYFLSVLVLGLPLMIAELMLGSLGRTSPISTFRRLTEQSHAAGAWIAVGAVGVLSGLLILSYLGVVAGWVIAFTLRSAFGALDGLTVDGINILFSTLVKDPERQLFWYTLFLAMTAGVVSHGLHRGLERAARYGTPVLLVLLLTLTVYAALLPGAPRAWELLLMPDFGKLSAMGMLSAVGQAFFSLSLGTGVLLMYGAYIRRGAAIARLSGWVVGIDTITALAGCVIVYSLLFSAGLPLASGPRLVFQALPLAFNRAPLGHWFAPVFFVLLVLVAWLSAIALLEPAVAWVGERFAIGRGRAAWLCGAVAWTIGLAVMLSFNYWAFSFRVNDVTKKLGLFDVLQVATARWLLPWSGILIALFAGWVLKPQITRDALGLRSPCAYDAWLWLVRVVVPVLLFLVFLKLPGLFT